MFLSLRTGGFGSRYPINDPIVDIRPPNRIVNRHLQPKITINPRYSIHPPTYPPHTSSPNPTTTPNPPLTLSHFLNPQLNTTYNNTTSPLSSSPFPPPPPPHHDTSPSPPHPPSTSQPSCPNPADSRPASHPSKQHPHLTPDQPLAGYPHPRTDDSTTKRYMEIMSVVY